MLKKCLIRPIFSLCLTLTGVLGLELNAQIEGFTGGWEIENWEKTEIADGTTEMLSVADDQVEFSYNVNRGAPGGPGVPARFADYTITAPTNANITFDWEFTGNHRWWEAYEEFHVIVNGEEVNTPLPEFKSVGAFTHFGSNETVSVQAGDIFGFRIGGRNFDSTSILDGLLRVTNFEVEVLAGAPLDLFIFPSEITTGTFDFEWPSREGKVYDLKSSTDLSIPVGDWEVWDNRLNIPAAAGAKTRIEALAPDGDRRFFVIVEKDGPG